MSITVTDPDVALDGLQHGALDVHAARMLPHIPRVAGSGCLSTDLLGRRQLVTPSY
ncbi:MAG: hypothetical protein V9G09_14155 [Candidatus Nanopelagicales bacterium]